MNYITKQLSSFFTILNFTNPTFLHHILKISSLYIGIVLFIIIFHLLFSIYIKYFIEIFYKINEIASGDFKVRISKNSKNLKNKLGILAKNINLIMENFDSVIIENKNSEKTKLDLITSISHDLRTPLVSILGYLQLINKDEYKDEFVLRSYVSIAFNKTKTLKILIDDLFQLTTLNNYGLKISKEKIDIIELIKQLVIEYRFSFEKSNIECRLHFTDEKIYILGDISKLVRAFENLIVNCIKYSKCSKYMDIYVDKQENEVTFEFVNYGDPIPPIDIPYIFQRFYRVEKSRGEETGGSGLGLAITKSIVELHDGKIFVESNVDKTNFKVILPC